MVPPPPASVAKKIALMRSIGDGDDIVTVRGGLNCEHTPSGITDEKDKALQVLALRLAYGNGLVRVEQIGKIEFNGSKDHRVLDRFPTSSPRTESSERVDRLPPSIPEPRQFQPESITRRIR